MYYIKNHSRSHVHTTYKKSCDILFCTVNLLKGKVPSGSSIRTLKWSPSLHKMMGWSCWGQKILIEAFSHWHHRKSISPSEVVNLSQVPFIASSVFFQDPSTLRTTNNMQSYTRLFVMQYELSFVNARVRDFVINWNLVLYLSGVNAINNQMYIWPVQLMINYRSIITF